jgi:DNA-binding NarL/FixJ family response regulator
MRLAEQLVLTPGTVGNHIGQLLDRLGVANRTQVAALVAGLGLHRANGEADAGD